MEGLGFWGLGFRIYGGYKIQGLEGLGPWVVYWSIFERIIVYYMVYQIRMLHSIL